MSVMALDTVSPAGVCGYPAELQQSHQLGPRVCSGSRYLLTCEAGACVLLPSLLVLFRAGVTPPCTPLSRTSQLLEWESTYKPQGTGESIRTCTEGSSVTSQDSSSPRDSQAQGPVWFYATRPGFQGPGALWWPLMARSSLQL